MVKLHVRRVPLALALLAWNATTSQTAATAALAPDPAPSAAASAAPSSAPGFATPDPLITPIPTAVPFLATPSATPAPTLAPTPPPTLAPTPPPTMAPAALPTAMATMLEPTAPPATAPPAPPATEPPAPPATEAPVPFPMATPAGTPAPEVIEVRKRGPGETLYAPLRYFTHTQWSCETFAGSDERRYVTAHGPYGFTFHTLVRLPDGKTTASRERYTYSWPHRAWKLEISGGGADGITAYSKHIEYGTYRFAGTANMGGESRKVRLLFHMYDDVIFRRDFLVYDRGAWHPAAGETCERNDFVGTKF